MNQLTFPWSDADSPLSSPAADSTELLVALGNPAAAQCRKAAAGLDKHVASKHKSADNMFALPPTRKRLQDGERLRRQAISLERIQRTLYILAEMHDNGTITPELDSLRSRGAVESALFNNASNSSIHAIFKSTERSETTSEKVQRLGQEALLCGIPGYFLTPPEIADKLVQFGMFRNIDEILEPSAGSGSLIDAVLKVHPEARIAYCEINAHLVDLLQLKYQESQSVRLLQRDFRELANRDGDSHFSAIIMNPPFKKGKT